MMHSLAPTAPAIGCSSIVRPFCGAPRRWEVVALRSPDESNRLCVKRVVGLPGEHVQIRDGDVMINGQVAHKTIADQRAMAIVVDDATPSKGHRDSRPNCWQDPLGVWKSSGGRFVHPATAATASVHWLTYHHPRAFSPGEPPLDGPILDESPYDQDESRVLNPLSDIVLGCQFSATGTGDVLLTASTRGQTFLVRLDVDSGAGTLQRNGQVVASFDARPLGDAKPRRLEWLLADQRVRLALDDRLQLDHPYAPQRPTRGAQPATWRSARGGQPWNCGNSKSHATSISPRIPHIGKPKFASGPTNTCC